jgi:hypothetical protein
MVFKIVEAAAAINLKIHLSGQAGGTSACRSATAGAI